MTDNDGPPMKICYLLFIAFIMAFSIEIIGGRLVYRTYPPETDLGYDFNSIVNMGLASKLVPQAYVLSDKTDHFAMGYSRADIWVKLFVIDEVLSVMALFVIFENWVLKREIWSGVF